VNALEIAIYVFLTSQSGAPFECAPTDSDQIFCSNGVRVSEAKPGIYELSSGITIEKIRGGELRFSNGLTAFRNSVGWIEFSNGLSVRKLKPGLYKFNNGYACSAEGADLARCGP
jgi:hypothetical protein